jgi:hypothetical protein
MWKETVNRLDVLARDVREAKNVMEAANFARFISFSGLIQFFTENRSDLKHLEIDGSLVKKKVDDLIFECGELFRGGRADPKYAASDIAEINRKLDLLTTALSGTEQVVTVVTSTRRKGSIVNAVEMAQHRENSDLTVLCGKDARSRAKAAAVPADMTLETARGSWEQFQAGVRER